MTGAIQNRAIGNDNTSDTMEAINFFWKKKQKIVLIVAALYKHSGDSNMCGRLVTWPLKHHHPLVENAADGNG